jgi:hypothetical protein
MVNSISCRLAAVSLAFLAALSACSTQQVRTDYSELASANGDRVHWLSVSDFWALRQFKVEAILIGDLEVQENELFELYDLSLDKPGEVQVLASASAKRIITSTRSGTHLGSIINTYVNRLLSRDFALEMGERPAFQIIILQQNEDIALRRSSWSLSGLEIPILIQIDGSSTQSISTSVARQVAILGHEWVHVAARAGTLSIPGSNAEDSMLNEEVFASLVEFCDSYGNLIDLEGASALNITLHRVISAHSDDADSHYQAIGDLGQSPAGEFLAGMILYQGLPTEVPLEADEIDRLLRRCERLTNSPDDYTARYAKNGFPDEWDQYLQKIETAELD